jgi:hypothetical protein
MAELTPAQKQKQFKNMDELYNYADNRNVQLEVQNFDHKIAYELEHLDGSKFFITNALLELVRYTKGSIDETVYIVYSEHHHPLSYMESDLRSEPIMVKLVNGKKKKG